MTPNIISLLTNSLNAVKKSENRTLNVARPVKNCPALLCHCLNRPEGQVQSPRDRSWECWNARKVAIRTSHRTSNKYERVA